MKKKKAVTADDYLQKFKEACVLVEGYARSIGPNCEIIFMNHGNGMSKGVQVAPIDWSGDVCEPDLFTALTTAYKEK